MRDVLPVRIRTNGFLGRDSRGKSFTLYGPGRVGGRRDRLGQEHLLVNEVEQHWQYSVRWRVYYPLHCDGRMTSLL